MIVTNSVMKIAISVVILVFAICLFKRLSKDISKDNSDVYELKVPSILSKLCRVYVVIGTMFSVAAGILSFYTDQVTNGHYYIGMAFVIIGIIGMIFIVDWKITITPTDVIYRNIFGFQRSFKKKDMTKYKFGRKCEIIIWFGKRKINIDPLAENASRLAEEIESWK